MSNHLRAVVKDQSEEFVGEFPLTRFADVGGDLTPHVSDENDVPQGRVAAKFSEHVEIPSGNSTEPIVGNPVYVDDPGKQRPFLVSVQKFILGGRENDDVRLRAGQESCNDLQNFGITL